MSKSGATISIPIGAETYSSAMADAKNYISWILASFSDYLVAPVLEIAVATQNAGVTAMPHADFQHRCGEVIRERGENPRDVVFRVGHCR